MSEEQKQSGRKAEVIMNEYEKFVGVVEGDCFHVEDYLHNGVSQSELIAPPSCSV